MLATLLLMFGAVASIATMMPADSSGNGEDEALRPQVEDETNPTDGEGAGTDLLDDGRDPADVASGGKLLTPERAGNLSHWAGQEVRVGTPGDDTIKGAWGGAYLLGGAGEDVLSGGPGDDVLDHFGSTAERWHGHAQDQWFEDAGTDTLYGGAGNDRLQVGAGDVVHGGTGADTIEGFVALPYDVDPLADAFAGAFSPAAFAEVALEDHDPAPSLTVQDFTPGEDLLELVVELPEWPESLLSMETEVRYDPETDETGVWLTVRAHDPLFDEATGNWARDGAGDLVPAPDRSEIMFDTTLVARLQGDVDLADSDILLRPFWNVQS